MEESQRQEAVVKIQAERSFLGHPRGIGVLSFRYMTNSFANYGMMAVLVYYLYAAVPGGLGLGKTDAAQLMSLFNALVILFSAVGSYMADRVFGIRGALRLNALVLPIAYIVLSIPGLGIPGYALSMGLLLFGSMISGRALDSLTGKMYAKGDKRRDGAFAITYVISNIGAMIPSVTGTIALISGYHAAFALCAVMSTLGSILYLILERTMFGPIGSEPDDPLPPKAREMTVGMMLGIIAVVTVALVLLFTQGILTVKSFSNMVSTVSLFIPFGYLVYILTSPKTLPEEKKHIFYLIPMFISSSVAMLVWYQATSILSIYAETSVNLVFFGHQVTPAIYWTLQAVFAVLFGSVVTGLWGKLGNKQPSTPAKMGIGTALYGIGTLIMVIPFQMYAPGVKASPFWLVAVYALVIIGEAISYPAGNSAASIVAPAAFSTQMMTVWAMGLSTGASLSTLVSNFYREGHESGYFLAIGGVTVAVGCTVFLLSKKLAIGMGFREKQ